MCFSSGSSYDSAAQGAETDKQIAAQQAMNTASLAQSKQIADEQARQNQESLDFTRAQDVRSLEQAQQQAARQATWDVGRGQRASYATNSIDNAFSQFTPDYFKNYKDAYYGQADSELQRQFGLSKKDMTFGLARAGQLAGTNAADQEGKLAETLGRAETDQMNKASDAANTLQTNLATAKNSLTSQALSSDTLGSPIASDNDVSLTSSIDAANRAAISVAGNATNYASSIKPVDPSLGTLSGVFTGALTGVANNLSGRQDAQIAGAYGGSNVNATGFGKSSTRIY